MFYPIFLPPQVKLGAIFSNKHGIYELPHKLLNDLKLKTERLKLQFVSNILQMIVDSSSLVL